MSERNPRPEFRLATNFVILEILKGLSESGEDLADWVESTMTEKPFQGHDCLFVDVKSLDGMASLRMVGESIDWWERMVSLGGEQL